MAEEGSKQVAITGLDDKRQITNVLAETLSAKLLPLQVIYQGTTSQCHPKVNFPKDWDITHSQNHWSNTTTMKDYISNILVPYIEAVKEELDLPVRQRALMLLDAFKAHKVPEVIQNMKGNYIEVVFVPGGCTSELQPLDIAGNLVFKNALGDKFTEWYSGLITEGLDSGKEIERLSYLQSDQSYIMI